MREFSVETLGGTTRAWEIGPASGAPFIFVHGFRGDHHGLEGIARRLNTLVPELRIIVPDLPAFGMTPSITGRVHDLPLYGEWLVSFVNAVAENGYAVLGHSFGSLVVSAAIQQGLQPSRLILVNPISAPALEGPQAFLTSLALAYYRVARMLPESAARRLLGSPLIVRPMSEVMARTTDRELRRWIHQQHRTYFSTFESSATLLESFRASVSHTVAEFVENMTMPTLVIAGEHDDIAPLLAQAKLVQRLPNAALRIVSNSGHLVHYEAVDDASDEIAQFLRSTAHDNSAQGDATQADKTQGDGR